MWNYLKGLLRGPLGLYSSIFFIISTIFFVFLVSPQSEMSFLEAFSCWLAVAAYFGFQLIIHPSKEFTNVVPYWGEKFGIEQCIRLLSEDSFKPYVNKKGRTIKGFEVSESGRWFSIGGQYYPTYLVFDLEPSKGELTMIDGAKVEIEVRKDYKIIKRALEEYLKGAKTFRIDNDCRINIAPADCAWAFDRCFNGDYKALARADWDESRYIWEMTLSNLGVRVLKPSESKEHTKALKDPGFAGDAILTRVLSDEEIQIIADAIMDGTLKNTKKWFRLNTYKDDLYVCNGVNLLKAIGYPDNKAEIQFLFDCLRDIQKPYFMDAVIALEKFPYDDMVVIIEQYVEKAHASEDVLWGAGLLYLSKRIGYEISLEKDKNEIGKTLSTGGL